MIVATPFPIYKKISIVNNRTLFNTININNAGKELNYGGQTKIILRYNVPVTSGSNLDALLTAENIEQNSTLRVQPLSGSYSEDKYPNSVWTPEPLVSSVWKEYPFLSADSGANANTLILTCYIDGKRSELSIYDLIQETDRNRLDNSTFDGVAMLGTKGKQIMHKLITRYYPYLRAPDLKKADLLWWPRMRYSMGGYSAYSVDDFRNYWRSLRSPVPGFNINNSNRVLLVGEHTDDLFMGYMEGAVRSGQKAADGIINPSN